VFNNLFLVAACATVLVGTLYPLALEALTGEKISVGAPFFHLTFVPLMIPLLLALPFGPMLGWKRSDLLGASQRLGVAMIAALIATVATYVVMGGRGVLAPLGLALGVWLVAGSLVDLGERLMLFRVPLATSLSRFRGLPRSALGTVTAHCGMGLCVIGLVSASAYSTETIGAVKPGETLKAGDYTLAFDGIAPATGPNYTEERMLFTVSRDGGGSFQVAPAKRFYQARQMQTTEAAIKTIGLSQLYISLGDRMDNGAQAVRASYKPLVTLIWLGPIVMAIGGGLSLSDRRLRIGAPRRAATRASGTAPA
jgi:cytochrome c-type biogenesis protein CcmF